MPKKTDINDMSMADSHGDMSSKSGILDHANRIDDCDSNTKKNKRFVCLLVILIVVLVVLTVIGVVWASVLIPKNDTGTDKQVVYVAEIVLREEWIHAYLNTSSTEYRDKKEAIEKALDKALRGGNVKSLYSHTEVTRLRQGSVIAHFKVYINLPKDKEHLSNGTVVISYEDTEVKVQVAEIIKNSIKGSVRLNIDTDRIKVKVAVSLHETTSSIQTTTPSSKAITASTIPIKSARTVMSNPPTSVTPNSTQPKKTGAKPPNVISDFLPLIYFRDVTDQKQFECKAEGIPEVHYEWKINGVTITPDPGTTELNGGVLKLLRPTLNHEGSYQCFASNSHGTSVSSVIEIRKARLLGYVSLPIEDKGSFDEGSHVVLTCRNQPESVPTAVYDWYFGKSDAILTGGRVVIDQDGDLHFINVETGDQLPEAKTYNCSLYNVIAQLRVYGSPTKFKVTPSPGPITPRAPTVAWFTASDKAIALLGKTITLQCIPDGYPIPVIEWAKRDGVLPPGRHTVVVDKYALEISNVTEIDEGTYTCTAVHGNQTSEQTIFLDVKSEPIWINKLKSMTVTNGKTAQFECVARSAVGERDNVVVQWFKNGKPLSSGQTLKILVKGTELIVYNVLKPYDLMNIQCTVSNSLGYQLADAFLNVIDQTVLTVRPEPKIVIYPGKVVEVPISAICDPLYENHLTYRWSKDGQPVSTNTTHPVYVDVANKLVVNATRYIEGMAFQELLGNYSCLVSMGLENGEGDIVVFSHVSSKLDPERR